MNWDLRTYQHEGDRSHTHELVVASAWTVMFVLLVAASLLDRPTKPIETAQTSPSQSMSPTILETITCPSVIRC